MRLMLMVRRNNNIRDCLSMGRRDLMDVGEKNGWVGLWQKGRHARDSTPLLCHSFP